MKLSEIRGERTFDVLADIIGPIVSIASDDDAARIFQREECPKGMEPREFAMQKVRKHVPVLLREHKTDLIEIIACLKQMTPEKYAEELSLVSLAKDVMELMTDEEFIGFLS